MGIFFTSFFEVEEQSQVFNLRFKKANWQYLTPFLEVMILAIVSPAFFFLVLVSSTDEIEEILSLL